MPNPIGRKAKYLLRLLMIGAVALGLPSAGVRAADSAQQKPQAPKSPFSLTLQSVLESNLFDLKDPDHSADTQLWIGPSYKLSDQVTLSGLLIVQKDLTGLQEVNIVKTSLTARHKGRDLNPYLSLSPALNLTLPFTNHAIDRDSLILGASVAPRLSFDFSKKNVPISGFLDLSISKNFHQYETATDGSSNTQYKFTTWLVGDWGFFKDFNLELSLLRSTAWTYQSHTKNSFDFSEELSYAITPDFSVAVGHDNTGDVLRANGTDSNISFFDERSSTVYTSLSLKI